MFGIFSYDIPRNPYPLPVKLEALLPSGERITLGGADFSGGKFTFPYQLPADSELILSMMNRELCREKVAYPQDTTTPIVPSPPSQSHTPF